MKILKDIKLHLITVVIFGLLFPLFIWGVGLFFPDQANGLPIYKNNTLIGFKNIGQKFYSDKYFWGRPSAVDYNAAASGASNKGTNNKEYLDTVKSRIDRFLQSNPEIKRSEIPSDLMTASGSGLDPHISSMAAFIQIPRIAKARNLHRQELRMLIERHTEKPLLGLFGTERVNVLELNLALDDLKKD